LPQVLVHPATARIHPLVAETVGALVSKAALAHARLNVTVVGPIYGGSLPIARYLERAFRTLGHTTVLIDTSIACELFNAVRGTVKTKKAAGQLTGLLTNTLNEWCYARVVESQCDLCIVVAQAPVGPHFPVRLAKEGIVSAFWFVENWRHLTYWRDIAPYYDYFFHIQPGEFERRLTDLGCRRHAFVQTGCDPEIHKPMPLTAEELARYGCDVSFAGAAYHNRVQLFIGLTDYAFKIWGVDWKRVELEPLAQAKGQRFTPEQFAKIVAGSKINLNLHSSTVHEGVDPECDAVNPRVFEIAACGGFQLCDPCIGLDAFFDFESELPVYRTLTELRANIDYFLAHPDERNRVAQNARARALRDHTYVKRAQQMLDLLLQTHGTRILRKGLRIQRTVAEMAQRVGRETPLGEYLASLPPDLLFTQETINELLGKRKPPLTFPESVFLYLSEVRNSAEALLEEEER
jgi:spore maturation protein CgeB